MDSYRCDKVIPKDTLAVTISDTVEYCHDHLTMPSVAPADKILYGLHSITGALANVPTVYADAQLKAIDNLRNACHQWLGSVNPPSPPPIAPTVPASTVHTQPTQRSPHAVSCGTRCPLHAFSYAGFC